MARIAVTDTTGNVGPAFESTDHKPHPPNTRIPAP